MNEKSAGMFDILGSFGRTAGRLGGAVKPLARTIGSAAAPAAKAVTGVASQTLNSFGSPGSVGRVLGKVGIGAGVAGGVADLTSKYPGQLGLPSAIQGWRAGLPQSAPAHKPIYPPVKAPTAPGFSPVTSPTDEELNEKRGCSMTPKEVFKVAFLSRFADAGLSFDEMAEKVDAIHSRLVKQASMMSTEGSGQVLAAPRETSMSTKPMTAPCTGISKPPAVKSAWLSGLVDAGGKAVDFMTSKALPAAIIAPALAGAGVGYGIGKLTDVDDTDIDEVKSRELIDHYKRWTTHLQQQRQMKEKTQASERPYYNRF